MDSPDATEARELQRVQRLVESAEVLLDHAKAAAVKARNAPVSYEARALTFTVKCFAEGVVRLMDLMCLVVALGALSACGSVDLAGGVDSSAPASEVGSAGRADREVGLAPETPGTDASASDAGSTSPRGEVLPPPSSPSCAAAAAAAGYVACRTCKGPAGEDLSRQCRAVVDCVASDPKYSPLVQTCNMTVGTGNGDDAAAACVLGVLRGCVG